MPFPDGETAAERSLRGRTAVLTSWANTEDWTARTAPGRAAFMRRFEDQVDPDRTLPDEERAKRADAAKRAHFARLARQSAAKRRQKAVRPK